MDEIKPGETWKQWVERHSPPEMRNDLKFEYDPARDCLTVEGNEFAGDFFRFFQPRFEGKLFRLVRVEGKSITVCEVRGDGNPL